RCNSSAVVRLSGSSAAVRHGVHHAVVGAPRGAEGPDQSDLESLVSGGMASHSRRGAGRPVMTDLRQRVVGLANLSIKIARSKPAVVLSAAALCWLLVMTL